MKFIWKSDCGFYIETVIIEKDEEIIGDRNKILMCFK